MQGWLCNADFHGIGTRASQHQCIALVHHGARSDGGGKRQAICAHIRVLTKKCIAGAFQVAEANAGTYAGVKLSDPVLR